MPDATNRSVCDNHSMRLGRPAVALLAAALATACGEPPTNRSCGEDYRTPTPLAVVCPGTACCDTPQVCCVELDEEGRPADGACSPATSCNTLPMTCDGPEECNAGEICCLTLQGSSCKEGAPDDTCAGVNEAALCHENSDCVRPDYCAPFREDSYFGPAMGACGPQ